MKRLEKCISNFKNISDDLIDLSKFLSALKTICDFLGPVVESIG